MRHRGARHGRNQSEKARKNLKIVVDIRQCAVGLSDVPQKENVFAITTSTGAMLTSARNRARACSLADGV